MSSARNTAAIMVHHGLGDVVMALPMLCDVDRNLPRDWSMLLIAKSALEEGLLRQVAWRHTTRFLQAGADRSMKGVLRLVSLAAQIRRERPALFLAPHMHAGRLSGLFAAGIRAPRAVGMEGKWRKLGFSDGIVVPDGEHKVRSFAKFAEAVGLRDASAPLLYPELRTQMVAPPPPRTHRIVFAPGSGEAEKHKRWPTMHFAELARALLDHDRNIDIAVFGSQAEKGLLADIRAKSGLGARLGILVSGTIAESLSMLAAADCVVAACSGSLHLAALLKRPAVALYGPTNPSITGPYSKALTVVRLGMKCSPCYRADFHTGCGDPVCMRNIAVQHVFTAVLDALEGKFAPPAGPLRTTAARRPSHDLAGS